MSAVNPLRAIRDSDNVGTETASEDVSGCVNIHSSLFIGLRKFFLLLDYISFSAHTDYEQTSEFIRILKPPHVVGIVMIT